MESEIIDIGVVPPLVSLKWWPYSSSSRWNASARVGPMWRFMHVQHRKRVTQEKLFSSGEMKCMEEAGKGDAAF